MAAPSASNERPWRFLVVREREMRERLAAATPFAKPIAGAPVGIVVCADTKAAKYPGFWVIDCSAAIQNMLLAAHAIGLGGVWIGVHPMAPLSISVRHAIGGLPRHIKPHSMIALGHPAEERPPVDRYDESFVHLERW
jgi:nitroreductase